MDNRMMLLLFEEEGCFVTMLLVGTHVKREGGSTPHCLGRPHSVPNPSFTVGDFTQHLGLCVFRKMWFIDCSYLHVHCTLNKKKHVQHRPFSPPFYRL